MMEMKKMNDNKVTTPSYLTGAIDAVGEFMTACDQVVNTKPTYVPANVALLRLKLTLEEVTEFAESILISCCTDNKSANDIMQHLAFARNSLDEFIKDDTKPYVIPLRMDEALDAITDIEYVNIGAAKAFGFDLEESFRRVHESNMSKLGEDGKAIKDASGKVQKGPNYKAPDLTGLWETHQPN